MQHKLTSNVHSFHTARMHMMSKDKAIILRIQSAEGTKRIEISLSASTCDLYERTRHAFGEEGFKFAIYRGKNGKDEISSRRSRTLRALGLQHGDMLYMQPIEGSTTDSNASEEQTSTLSEVEDDVDVLLMKMDGKIERQRDPKLCHHNSFSRCFNCTPLEPFDEDYLREHNIKHLSFHSYLRKMMSGADQGKFLLLEDVTCRIRTGCVDHLPWPKGICSKCQPSSITLNQQSYRHVDNVQFENAKIVEKFLNYWRITGNQRIGFLFGRYEVHPDVPLGIRTVVCAIYEPPQKSNRDSVLLLPDDKHEFVQHLSTMLGLKPVGWIFTDLMPHDVKKGTVRHTRHSGSYFLSAQECFMAAYYQNQHPNACKYASTGTFGSKFCTVCVTGDSTNHIHMEGYQVSNQCMALVRDDCFVPTKDAPELGYIRESSDRQYVPDVYFKEKDTYGNEVSRLGRPLPVEYLLLDVPTSTPLTPVYTFNPDTDKEPFPVENRVIDGHIQDFNALSRYWSQFHKRDFFNGISDFHLLIYIATMDMLPLQDSMDALLIAIRNGNEKAAKEWADSEQWATIEELIAVSSPPTSRPGSSLDARVISPPPSASQWTCPFCTYLNSSATFTCEMCNLPRNSPPQH